MWSHVLLVIAHCTVLVINIYNIFCISVFTRSIQYYSIFICVLCTKTDYLFIKPNLFIKLLSSAFTEQTGYLLGNHQLFISSDYVQSNLALWGANFSGAAAAAIYIIELLVNTDSQEGKIVLERLSY